MPVMMMVMVAMVMMVVTVALNEAGVCKVSTCRHGDDNSEQSQKRFHAYSPIFERSQRSRRFAASIFALTDIGGVGAIQIRKALFLPNAVAN